jgi:hypothetical protein
MNDTPSSGRKTLMVYPLTRKRVNKIREHFGLSQDAIINKALTSLLKQEKITYKDISDSELSELTALIEK